MTSGGDIVNNDKVPGLKSGANVLFNNPWTFLPPGTTAQRPAPSATINYRLRFNTDDQLYEYYDAVLLQWTQLQESAFTVGPFITYKADASLPDAQNLGLLANGILKQSITAGIATLDIAVAATDYWAPGNALTRSQAPTVGNDVTNKTYVDSLIGGVASIQGTQFQVLANGTFGAPQTGAVILTLPQSIAPTNTPTFAGLTLTAPLTGANGGTGVNNGANTITLGGSLSTIGAFTAAFTMTGNTAVTFPTSGTLATTSGASGHVNAGNINELTWYAANGDTVSGLTTATSAVLTTVLGVPTWANQLSLALGGTNANLTASNGGIFYSTASAAAILAGTATANLPLLSGISSTPSWGSFPLSLGGALTTAGAHTLSGAFASTFTLTNTTNVTFPTSGTLATTSQLPTPAALTKVDDTNVTLTLGGTPSTALLQATSITVGWAGNLSLARGGTGATNVASAGAIAYSTPSAILLSAVGSKVGQIFQSNITSAPTWSVPAYPSASGTAGQMIRSNGIDNVYSTATYPSTTTINELLYSSAANTIVGLATANNGVLTTSAGGVPSISSTLPTAVQQNITMLGILVAPITFQLPGGVNAGGTISSVSVAQFEGNYSAGAVTGSYGNIAVLNDRNQNEAALFGAYRIGAGGSAWLSLGVRNSGVDNITAIMDSDGDLALNSNCYATAFFLSVNPFDTVTTGVTKAFFLNASVMAQNTNAHLADPGQTDVGQVYLSDSTFVSKGIASHNANGLLTLVNSSIWHTTVSSIGQNMTVGGSYTGTNSSLQIYNLPTTAVAGDIVRINDAGTGRLRTGQASGQFIIVNNKTSTTGTSGYVQSTAQGNSITYECVVAPNEWITTSMIGNWDVI